MLHEYAQDREDFRCQRNGMAIAEQQVLRQVQAKGPELVRWRGRTAARPSGQREGAHGEKYWSFCGTFCKDYRRAAAGRSPPAVFTAREG